MARAKLGPVVTGSAVAGEVAVLADAYPLERHVTLRVAGDADRPCACGRPAAFVLLASDVASEPPHANDLHFRMSYDWERMLVATCGECLPQILATVGHDAAHG